MNPDALTAAADRCVKCGLCLPHCPTYGLRQHEAESPRGRIALIQGLVEGVIEDDDEVRAHLDACLLCRNCEPVCPSGVAFGELMDGVRARLAEGRRPALLLQILTDPARLGLLAGAGAWVQRLHLAALVPGSYQEPLQWLTRRGPASGRRIDAGDRPASRRVALFTGCVTRVTDAPAIAAATRLLAALGIGVDIPAQQGCCGALHLHAGFPAQAEDFARRNQEAFVGPDLEAVVAVASGCGAHLAEHGGLGLPVRDLGAYLAAQAWPEELLQALPAQSVALHQPCTLRNVLREDEAVLALLRRFPSLEVKVLESGCCGAAGLQLMSASGMASELARPLVDQLRQCGAPVLLTSNTGCALHLSSELRAAGLSVEVRHPVEFIAEQLGI